MAENTARIGFIGLGNMGGPMALNLQRAGYALTVHDLEAPKVEALVAAGAAAGGSCRGVAEACEIALVCLHAEEVAPVILGEDGVLAGMRPGGLIVDMGNCDPAETRRLAQLCAERGVELTDASVSGGATRSQAGTLAIMAGGPEAAFRRIEPMLRVVGEKVFHFGPQVGGGQLVKLLNNMFTRLHTAAAAEICSLAEGLGLDPVSLLELVNTSSGQSFVTGHALNLYRRPRETWGRYHRVEKSGRLFQNQIPEWALGLARGAGVPMPITGLFHELRKMNSPQDPCRLVDLMEAIEWEFAFPHDD